MNNGPTPRWQRMRRLGAAFFFAYFDRRNNDEDYGRCVYHCDTDVVDNQIVNMEMENGIHCQLMMTAFTDHDGRSIRVMGTMGTIEADMNDNIIHIQPFGKPHQHINVNDLLNGCGSDAQFARRRYSISRGILIKAP